jgi:hypothetical protein
MMHTRVHSSQYYHPLFRFITFPSDATITASGGQQHGRSLQAVPPYDGMQQKERVLYSAMALLSFADELAVGMGF